MTKIIEIQIPYEEIIAREKRVVKTKRFEATDRVPVIPAINYRFLLPILGVRFRDYYHDPRIMLHSQILGQKWLMEHVKTDAYSITGAWVGGWTDFQNATDSSALGCKIDFPEDNIPIVRQEGWVRTEVDLRRLEQMDIIRGGLNGKQIEFRKAMQIIAEDYPVRFQDGPVFYPGANPWLTNTSQGPFTMAGDLMGVMELFAGTLERPAFVRELFRIITDKMIEWLDFCWDEMLLPDCNFAWTDDLAQGLSAKVYHDLVLPFEQKLRFHFDGWASLHMCGRTEHLLDIFTNEVQINEYQGFGWQVDLDKIARSMGGKVVLVGNVSPLTIQFGTPDQVKAATRKVIEKLSPYGGLIVQDGNNIAPGSPLENINAMLDAAVEYGSIGI
jgi:uroporphyrinogen-III decarboxylase